MAGYAAFLKKRLPELHSIESFISEHCVGRVEKVGITKLPTEAPYLDMTVRELPIYKISYGTEDLSRPTLVLVGGVHGLERIGTQVVNSLLFSFNELTKWDDQVREALERMRIIFIPLLNPWGMALNRRSNANGVDLMRNAPIEAVGKTVPLLSGHRIGAALPWYRGEASGVLEVEAQVLINEMKKEIFQSQAVMSLDVHSGFGFRDQLWFPYAKSLEPFGHLAEMMAIKEILDKTYPYHVYKVEPQALNYVTHGDLWDYIYDEYCMANSSTYVPLCLEMGSWTWVRKNPRQIFLPGGIFDPILPHRRHRAFRRHHLLFDLLIRLIMNSEHWATLSKNESERLAKSAKALWYSKPR